MKTLLDTHIFIWWDSNPDRLSPTARAMCQDAQNTLILSVASIWENANKGSIGKVEISTAVGIVGSKPTRDKLYRSSICYSDSCSCA